jgi:hypothetical protein
VSHIELLSTKGNIMNLGIVIAISDYGSPSINLPGCDADGLAISKILKTDNKFDDVLYLSKKTSSGDIKPELIKFINGHKANDIDDVVFYFSGHGDFSGDEFYYLLSDYDSKRKKQTSLENTELDNLLKALNPNNAIKIVDACHSGTPYIKDPDAFDTYLKGTQGEFKKCYFMFSSQTDQYSYQDSNLSFFTKSIVESVQSHTSEIIRYKDVIDFVSDSFSESHNQTPFFIVQADFTEPFCTVSKTLRESLENLFLGDIVAHKTKEGDADSGVEKTLMDLVKEDANRYCTEEEALEYLSSFFAGFKKLTLSDKVTDLYDISFEDVSEYSEIPTPSAIGKWLDSNDHDFFARAYKEDIKVRSRVHKDPMKRMLGGSSWGRLGMDDDDDYKFVVKTENRIKGFRSTIDLPVKLLKVNVDTKFPNIDSASIFIVPVISKTKMRIFFSFNFYEQKDWNGKKIEGSAKWLTEIVDIKDKTSHNNICSKIMSEFSEFVYEPIAEKFDLVEQDDETEELKGAGN